MGGVMRPAASHPMSDRSATLYADDSGRDGHEKAAKLGYTLSLA